MNSKKIYGLLGAKLAHSFSRKYFTQKFENEMINCVYLNYELSSIQEVETLLTQKDINGLNVTIPYKESIIPLLDVLAPSAANVMAVNTVQFKEGKTIGHNTDVFGFKQLIKPFFEPQHERALILGTGGAAKAVAWVLEEIGATVTFISRTPSGEDQYGYGDINGQMLESCKVIVNTTPVGTFPEVEDCPKFPFEFLTPKHLVVDLIYNPDKTRFLENAEKQGAWIVNGKTMLEQQAEKSWEIWNS